MKQFLLVACLGISLTAGAQVGIGTPTPNASALLDITSTTKGILVPRMTSAQKTAISTPATGLMIYQTDGTTGFYYYDGASWNQVNAGTTTGANGGTGVANTGKTITLGGNLTTSGAFATTLTSTAATTVTLPTTGTLATLAGTETFTNKTLTSPVISTIVNTGTLTLPTTTGTLALTSSNITGNAATVTTNANLTGNVTSVGNATTIASGVVTNAMLAGSIDLTAKVTGALPIANGGTGSATQNFVDLSATQTIGGAKTFSSTTTHSGALTGGNTASSTIAGFAASINTQTGTTYTLVAADNGKIVTLNNASAITLTVPSTLPAGFNCMIVQLGAGQVTFSGSGATISNRSSLTKTAGQNAIATLIALSSTSFISSGDMN